MPFVTSRSVWLPEKRVSWAHPSARIRSVVRFTTGSPFAQVRFTTQTHVAARREPKPTKNTHLMQPAHTTLLQSARKPKLIRDHLGPTDDKAYLETYKYKELERGEDPVQRVLYEHSLTYQGLSYNKQD